jgi:feruloyl-CoA synthase
MMTEPPNIDAGEITDKGYLNQRAILARRTALAERIYSEKPGDDVVVA